MRPLTRQLAALTRTQPIVRFLSTTSPASASPQSQPQPPSQTPAPPQLRRDIDFSQLGEWPDLAAFRPVLDGAGAVRVNEFEIGQGRQGKVVYLNNERMYEPQPVSNRVNEKDPLSALARSTPFTLPHLRSLTRFTFPLVVKRVVHQTKKGKLPARYALVVCGNGAGMVGVGEGKADGNREAVRKATVQAVRNMDYVDRAEGRTVWGNIETKAGASTVHLRSRPAGFGLRCSPIVHQVAKAAGLSDLSAKCWGSRNPMNVVKATLKALHGGAQPVLFGQGTGAKVPRLERGRGMKTADEIALERGRKVVPVGKRVV